MLQHNIGISNWIFRKLVFCYCALLSNVHWVWVCFMKCCISNALTLFKLRCWMFRAFYSQSMCPRCACSFQHLDHFEVWSFAYQFVLLSMLSHIQLAHDSCDVQACSHTHTHSDVAKWNFTPNQVKLGIESVECIKNLQKKKNEYCWKNEVETSHFADEKKNRTSRTGSESGKRPNIIDTFLFVLKTNWKDWTQKREQKKKYNT